MTRAFSSKTVAWALCGFVGLFAGACEEESAQEHEDHGHDDHGHEDHGHGEHEHDEYKEGGITKMTEGGHYMVTLVADPEPPSRGLNTWVLTVMHHEDMSMVDGATVAIEPWMPDHGHGSDAVAVVEATGEGDYMSETVSLHMLGTWDTTVTITDGDMTDEVHFVFMVE